MPKYICLSAVIKCILKSAKIDWNNDYQYNIFKMSKNHDEYQDETHELLMGDNSGILIQDNNYPELNDILNIYFEDIYKRFKGNL